MDRSCRLHTVVNFFSTGVVLAGLWLLVSPSPLYAQQAPEENPGPQTYESVEERRLQVRIVDANEGVNEANRLLLLKQKELEKLEKEIDLKLEELDRKLNDLAKQKAELKKIQVGAGHTTARPAQNLSRIYEQMDPFRAATALSNLEPETAASILTGMKSRQAARILDIMQTARATEITRILTGSANK